MLKFGEASIPEWLVMAWKVCPHCGKPFTNKDVIVTRAIKPKRIHTDCRHYLESLAKIEVVVCTKGDCDRARLRNEGCWHTDGKKAAMLRPLMVEISFKEGCPDHVNYKRRWRIRGSSVK